MDDNLAASEIESYFAARGPALLGVLPITTSDGNAGNKGDVVYGARAIRRLFDAIASGADFTDLEAVRKCLEPETASSSDLANALAILCQGYLAAAVSMKLDSIMDADVQRALVLIGHSRELFIDPAKAQEVLSPRWWKSPFSERPSIKSGPAGEIDRLLSAIWDEEDPESASIELSTVVGAYLELIG